MGWHQKSQKAPPQILHSLGGDLRGAARFPSPFRNIPPTGQSVPLDSAPTHRLWLFSVETILLGTGATTQEGLHDRKESLNIYFWPQI